MWFLTDDTWNRNKIIMTCDHDSSVATNGCPAHANYYGLAVASPYVGMARFQDGGSNQCISVFTAISSPENKY